MLCPNVHSKVLQCAITRTEINTNLPSRKWNEWVNEEVEIGKTESIYIEAPEKS